jgi:DNA-binding transcriptional LysR family regulator
LQAVDAGSFSAAARQLDITPALASRAVQRLEEGLSVRLFLRSTRSMQLSEDGQRYLPHARATLQAVTSGKLALAAAREEISGLLRISAPSDIGRNVLLPWLDAFQERYPKISLHMRLSDRAADLLRLPLDAAIRYGLPSDSTLIAQPLAPDNRRALCAAPAYLERHGAPRIPDDLRKHNCLRYVWGPEVHTRWSFQTPRGLEWVSITGDRISDDADVVRRWAVAGYGLVYKSRIDLSPDLHASRLIQLFPTAYGEAASLNLVIAHRSLLTPAIQRLRDFLRERIKEIQQLVPETVIEQPGVHHLERARITAPAVSTACT